MNIVRSISGTDCPMWMLKKALSKACANNDLNVPGVHRVPFWILTVFLVMGLMDT